MAPPPYRCLLAVFACFPSIVTSVAPIVGGAGYALSFMDSMKDAACTDGVMETYAGCTPAMGDSDPACVWTWTLWMRSYGEEGNSVPFSFGDESAEYGNDFELMTMFLPDTYLFAGVVLDFPASLKYADGKWHHMAAAFTVSANSGQVVVYEDGIVIIDETVYPGCDGSSCGDFKRPVQAGSSYLCLGQEQDSLKGGFDHNQALRGQLDELRMFRKFMSQEEIQVDMVTPSNAVDVAGNNLVIHYSFDDAEGSVVSNLGSDPNPDMVFMDNGDSVPPTWAPSSAPVQGSVIVSYVIAEIGNTIEITLQSDCDGSVCDIVVDSIPPSGTLTDKTSGVELSAGESVTDADRTIVYTVVDPTLIAAAAPFESFTYTATNADGSATGTVHIRSNSAPRIILGLREMTMLEVDPPRKLLLVGEDVDGQNMRARIDVLPENGMLYQALTSSTPDMDNPITEVGTFANLNFDGRYLFFIPTPDSLAAGLAEDYGLFQYVLVDEVGAESTVGTISIDVYFNDDLPTVVPQAQTLLEDASYTLLELEGSDVEGRNVQAMITTLPEHGRLFQVVEAADGTLSMGDEIIQEFRSWERNEPVVQWVNEVPIYNYNKYPAGECWNNNDCYVDVESGLCDNLGDTTSTDCPYDYDRKNTYGFVDSPEAVAGSGVKLMMSSEYSASAWGSAPLIGAPGICPEGGDNCPSGCLATTWAASYSDAVNMEQWMLYKEPFPWVDEDGDGLRDEFVDMKFERPVRVNEVEVYESWGAGSVIGMALMRPDGTWDQVLRMQDPRSDDKAVSNGSDQKLPRQYSCENTEEEKNCDMAPKQFNDPVTVRFAPVICEPNYLTNVVRLFFATYTVGWECIAGVRMIGEAALKEGFVEHKNRKLMYVPDPDYFGEDSFSFRTNDCLGGACAERKGFSTDTATVSLTVTNINDVPVAHDVSIAVTGNVDITLSAFDADGETLSFEIGTLDSVWGTLYADGVAVTTGDVVSVDTLVFEPVCDQGANFGTQLIGFRALDAVSESDWAQVSIGMDCGCDIFGKCQNGGDHDEACTICECVGGYKGNRCQIDMDLREGSLPGLAIAALVINAILFGLVVANWKRKVIKFASPKFLLLSLVGAFLTLGSIFPASTYSDDVNDSAMKTGCVLSQWMGHMGYIFIMAPLFSKTHRIARLFANKSMKKMVIKDNKLLVETAWLVGLWLVALILWTALEPPEPTLVTDSDGTSWVECDSTNFSSFSTALLGAEGVFMLWGVSLCWDIRNTPSAFNESKFIGIALYNTFFLGLIIVPLVFLMSSDQNTTYTITCVGIVLLTLSAQLLLLLPKFFIIFTGREDQYTSLSTSGKSTGGGTSTGNNTVDVKPTA